MDFVAIKAPAPRIALSGKALEFLKALSRIVAACQGLQVIADELIETLPKRLCLLASASHGLLINGEGDVHIHSICANVCCVNVYPVFVGIFA